MNNTRLINKRKFVSSIRDLSFFGSAKIARFLSKILISSPKGITTIETIYNFKMKIDPIEDNGIERAIYYFGTYEKGTLDVIGKMLTLGDTFVDIGANIGLMSLYASYAVGDSGKVISFEPNPKTHEMLKDNINLNNRQNIKPESFAISSETKDSKIYDRWDVNRGGASLIKHSESDQSYDIKEIVFSDYFSQTDEIKLIKIDVEGYELEVLKGAKKFITESQNPPMMVVEFSSKRNNTFGEDTAPLYTFIKDFNIFKMYKSALGKEKLSKLTEIKSISDLPEHDNIYCIPEKNLSKLPQSLFY